MHYKRYIVHACKYAIVLMGAYLLQPFLDMIIISQVQFASMLSDWFGKTGIVFMLSIETIVIPMIVTTYIGILGGLWIGGKSINGFLLSIIFYLLGFIIIITSHGIKYDWIMFLSILGLLIIPVYGLLIYFIFSKRFHTTSPIKTRMIT